ncbi:MAG: glycosyltransferase family 4 protein [Bdellovibrionota bacterium]
MQLSSDISRKVLIIAPQPFFTNRGTPLNVRAVCARLADLGYQVHLLALPHGEAIRMRGVRIHRCLKIPGVRSVPIGFSLRKTLYDGLLLLSACYLSLCFDFDVYHGIEEAGVIAGFVGLVRGRPYVVDMDSDMMEQLRGTPVEKCPGLVNLLAKLEAFFIRRATAVVTVCATLTAKARSQAASRRVFQIEDCPVEGDVPSPETLDVFRRKLSLIGKKVVLYTGNLEPYQGVDLLIESFACYLRRTDALSAAQLVIVGGTESQLVDAREVAERLGVPADRISFLGQQPLEEMASFMALADVLISPRRLGTNTPLKIYSYMSAGRPIVATNIVSHTQVLSEECAYLASPSAESLCAAMARALDDGSGAEAERAGKIAETLKRVETLYSRQCFNSKIQQLYSFVMRPETRLADESALDALAASELGAKSE